MDSVTKKLLNNFYKTQPALNMPGDPAEISGVLLGDLIERALSGIKSGLDEKTKKLLNNFHKTQPALQRPGQPAEFSGVLLGDIIDAALKQGTISATGVNYVSSGSGPYVVTVTSPAHGLPNGVTITVSAGSNPVVNGLRTITVIDANKFSFSVTGDDPETGTLNWTFTKSGVTLSDADVKLLNDLSKTQPALNKVGEPADKSGILLGDLLKAALE